MSSESPEKGIQNMDISESVGNNVMADIPIESPPSASSSTASSYPSPRQNSGSPVIVLTNADYKRPSSIIFASSGKKSDAGSSAASSDIDDGMLRNWKGTAFLTCHIIVGSIILFGAFIEALWNGFSLHDSKIRPIREINPLVAFLFSLFNMLAILAGLIVPIQVLFSSSSRYMKKYCYKENKFLYYSSLAEMLAGLFCASIHVYIQMKASEAHLTPYLPGSIFLLIHGLLNLRFYFEIVNGGDETGDSMMLPYKPEPSEEDESMVEKDDISVGV